MQERSCQNRQADKGEQSWRRGEPAKNADKDDGTAKRKYSEHCKGTVYGMYASRDIHPRRIYNRRFYGGLRIERGWAVIQNDKGRSNNGIVRGALNRKGE